MASMPPKICSAVRPCVRGHDARALDEPRPELGVAQVGLCLLQRRDGKLPRHWTVSETSDLRKNEPHPMAGLLTPLEFSEGPAIGPTGVLNGNKALQVEWVVSRHLSTEILV